MKPKISRDLNSAEMHFVSKFLNPYFNWSGVMAWTISKWGNLLFLYSIWPWWSRPITPQYNRDLSKSLLHLQSKFGDPSLNEWTSSGFTHTSVPNYCQSVSPKQTTLEEDPELFKKFSSILCLWFEIQGSRTDNFFDEFWTLHTHTHTYRCRDDHTR